MRYLIRLKPLSPFFFGSEKTFGSPGSNGKNGRNYYAKSTIFPQQTALLGMIRHEILIQKGLKRKDKDYRGREAEIKKYIGDRGFDFESSEFAGRGGGDYGLISQLGPAFLMDDKSNYYLKSPFGKKIKLYGEEGNANNSRCFTSAEKKIYLFLDYDPKDYSKCGYNKFKKLGNIYNKLDAIDRVPSDKVGAGSEISVDDIFRIESRVGICKNREEGTDDKFFKQDFFIFNRSKDYPAEFFFSFLLETNKEVDNNFKLEDDVVYIGADRSSFKMMAEIVSEQNPFDAVMGGVGLESNGINLLSDSFVSDSIYHYCDFSWTETADFRNITSSINNYSFNKPKSKCSILRAGSVLFSNDEGRLKKIENILNNPYCQKIGFNKFNKTFNRGYAI